MAKGIIELLVIEVITATPGAIDNKLIYCPTRMTYSTAPILKMLFVIRRSGATNMLVWYSVAESYKCYRTGCQILIGWFFKLRAQTAVCRLIIIVVEVEGILGDAFCF